jgi:type IV pilus assembly protein PilC
MEFRCRLGTPGGQVIEQTHVAESEDRLRRDLEEQGLYVLAIRPRGFSLLPQVGLGLRRGVKTREFLVFNQELATLLKAGMPLVQSLDILRQRVANPVFKGVLDDVHTRVRGGAALSEAFGEHAGLFPGIYTASLMAGERSGSLEQVLRRFVAYMKIVGEVRRRTISALVYPAILLSLSLIVVGIIVIRVVPAFSTFYGTFGRELPLATRAIVAFSKTVATLWPLLLLGAAAVVAAVVAWGRRPVNRARLHRAMLRLPFLGPVAGKFAVSQLARTLSTLLGGGIPLVNAIEVASRAIGNRFVAAQMAVVGERVREGESMAGAMLARGAVFPDVAIKMVEVGEQTGALQDMLNSLADFYDEEIETTLGRFVTLIEPALLVIMGLVIASLLLALYLPVFQLSSVAQ